MPVCFYDWSIVQRFHDEGHGMVDCVKHFGFSQTAWTKAIQRGALIPTGERDFADRRRRYDWAAVQRYYDEGHTYRECKARFGFCSESWHKAAKRGEIKPRPYGLPIEDLLLVGQRQNIKIRLLRAGILENRCSICGLTEWMSSALTMQIDHVNGAKNDHRLENLRMLCPNCHSQTATFAGRNVKRPPSLQEPGAIV
jgi:5-methylcytosine-specific restriction endonuclease McrA